MAETNRLRRTPDEEEAGGKGGAHEAADWLAPAPHLHRPKQIAAALAVAEAVFAGEDGPPPKARLEWLGRELDDFLERIGAEARNSYLLALFGLSVVAPMLMLTPTPLRSMPLEKRAEALSRVEGSFFSGALLAVKAMLCIMYYEQEDAADNIGFDRKCLHELGSRS